MQGLCPRSSLLSLTEYLRCFIHRVMELIFIHIMNTMKGSGMQTSGVAGEECIIQMVQFTRENGTIT